MCVVSDKIKFCTCVADDVEVDELNHYWILHRYNKDKNEMVMGLAMPPMIIVDPMYYVDEATILDRVNTAEAFDTELSFRDKDRLEIFFNALSEDEDDIISFQFEHQTGQWISPDEGFEPFSLMNYYDEIAQGEVKE